MIYIFVAFLILISILAFIFQRKYFELLQRQSKLEFENLAHRIFEEKTEKFKGQTEKQLETILSPLRDKLHGFEKKVDDSFNNEAKERFALKSEIEKLISLNDKMAFETNSLAQALRGDSKIQGDWGEMVLERILETSGLRDGYEYKKQVSLDSDEGDRFRPDILVYLPDEKHIVIDSKVSLKAYDLYQSVDDLEQKEKYLSEHIKSMERHLNELSSKQYSKLKGINSPEIVFMFVPIETAYILAMKKDSELSIRAWKKGIAIVTSTTLLTSLKTVASIWRPEKQNRNALEIAQEGAKLYDKFASLLEDLEKIGNTFELVHKQYLDAMNKLKGNGNLFKKIERLKELGAAPNKKINSELLDD